MCAATVAILVVVKSTHAFTPFLPRTTTTTLSGRTCPVRMAPLSNEEIFARAQQTKQQQREQQDAEPAPMLFDDDMLADMQAALLLMEERVKSGPGSLSLLQVDQLQAQLSKIRKEMIENEHLRPSKPVPQAQLLSSESGSPVVATVDAAPQIIDMDTPSDEGKAYDGHGGMGQAADTVNTYIIPGMDAMSPEEYQKTLQASVIARQQRRKETGVTGNRSSWDYLNSLTGETGVLKKEVSQEEPDEGDKGNQQKNFNPF